MRQSTENSQYKATCRTSDTATMTATNKVNESDVKHNSDVAMSSLQHACLALNYTPNSDILTKASEIYRARCVNFANSYLSSIGLRAITLALSTNTQLTELYLQNNGLDNNAVILLCKSFKAHGPEHICLETLDISDNKEVSLPAGLELLSLTHVCKSLKRINLTGTNIPEALEHKINRALEFNRSNITENSGGDSNSKNEMKNTNAAQCKNHNAITRTKVSQQNEHQDISLRETNVTKNDLRCNDVNRNNDNRVEVISERSNFNTYSCNEEWCVVEVAILAPPCLFYSELTQLIHNVFHRLNCELCECHVYLYPLVEAGTTASNSATPLPVYHRNQNGHDSIYFTALADVLATVARSKFVTIELIGDRPGDYAHKSAACLLQGKETSYSTLCKTQKKNDELDDDDKGDSKKHMNMTLQVIKEEEQICECNQEEKQELVPKDKEEEEIGKPVLYAAHTSTLETAQWLITAIRCTSAQMKLPPAHRALLSCNPEFIYFDKLNSIVKNVIDADSTSVARNKENDKVIDNLINKKVIDRQWHDFWGYAQRLVSSYEMEHLQWIKHKQFKENVLSSTNTSTKLNSSSTAVYTIKNYRACYDTINANGDVELKELEQFVEAIYERMRELCLHTFKPRIVLHKQQTWSSLLMEKLHHYTTKLLHFAKTAEQITCSINKTNALKTMLDRTHLYLIQPTSHNALVLHCNDNSLCQTTLPLCHPEIISTILLSAVQRLRKDMSNTYHTAYHSTHSLASTLHSMCNEPTDVREIMVNIIAQLFSHIPEVIRYIRVEVDVKRLEEFFAFIVTGKIKNSYYFSCQCEKQLTDKNKTIGETCNSNTTAITNITLLEETESAKLSSSVELARIYHDAVRAITSSFQINNTIEAAKRQLSTIVLVIDGVERVMTPVEPCKALRMCTFTNQDEWEMLSSCCMPNENDTTINHLKNNSVINDNCSTKSNSMQREFAAGAQNTSVGYLSFLPLCFARHVRCIIGCNTTNTTTRSFEPKNSSKPGKRQISALSQEEQTLHSLLSRGRDSVESFVFNAQDEANVFGSPEEYYLPDALRILYNVHLTEAQSTRVRLKCCGAFANINQRSHTNKNNNNNKEFEWYVIGALRRAEEEPGYATLTDILAHFPENVHDAALQYFDELEVKFGRPVMCKVYGLLQSTRWSLPELVLRELLQLPPRRFNALLRWLWPVTQQEICTCATTTTKDRKIIISNLAENTKYVNKVLQYSSENFDTKTTTSSFPPLDELNALHRTVQITSQSFLNAIKQRYAERLVRRRTSNATHEINISAIEEDSRVFHGILTHYYLNIIQDAIAFHDMQSRQIVGNKEYDNVAKTTEMQSSWLHVLPFQTLAVKEITHHVTMSNEWRLLDQHILSFQFIALVLSNELSYHFIRDMVSAFNTRHEQFVMGEDIGAIATPPSTNDLHKYENENNNKEQYTSKERKANVKFARSTGKTENSLEHYVLPPMLQRMKEYIYFIRRYHVILIEHPHLLVQVALQHKLQTGIVQYDALHFIYTQPIHCMSRCKTNGAAASFSITSEENNEQQCYYRAHQWITGKRTIRYFFVFPDTSSQTLQVTSSHNVTYHKSHLGAVNDVECSPNGKFLLSVGADKSLQWLHPESCAVYRHLPDLPSDGVRLYFASQTSSYVAVLTHMREVIIFDTATCECVSANPSSFKAPISCFTFSTRGRFYFVATEDVHVYVYDSEKSELICELNAVQLLRSCKDVFTQRSYVTVLADAVDEDVFVTFVNQELKMWRIHEGRDRCEPFAPVSADNNEEKKEDCVSNQLVQESSAELEEIQQQQDEVSKKQEYDGWCQLFSQQHWSHYSYFRFDCGKVKRVWWCDVTLTANTEENKNVLHKETRFFIVQPVSSCKLLLCALRHGYVKEIAYLDPFAQNEASATQYVSNINTTACPITTISNTKKVDAETNELRGTCEVKRTIIDCVMTRCKCSSTTNADENEGKEIAFSECMIIAVALDDGQVVLFKLSINNADNHVNTDECRITEQCVQVAKSRMERNACHLCKDENNSKETESPGCIAPVAIISTLCKGKKDKVKLALHIEDSLLFALCNEQQICVWNVSNYFNTTCSEIRLDGTSVTFSSRDKQQKIKMIDNSDGEYLHESNSITAWTFLPLTRTVCTTNATTNADAKTPTKIMSASNKRTNANSKHNESLNKCKGESECRSRIVIGDTKGSVYLINVK